MILMFHRYISLMVNSLKLHTIEDQIRVIFWCNPLQRHMMWKINGNCDSKKLWRKPTRYTSMVKHINVTTFKLFLKRPMNISKPI